VRSKSVIFIVTGRVRIDSKSSEQNQQDVLAVLHDRTSAATDLAARATGWVEKAMISVRIWASGAVESMSIAGILDSTVDHCLGRVSFVFRMSQ